VSGIPEPQASAVLGPNTFIAPDSTHDVQFFVADNR